MKIYKTRTSTGKWLKYYRYKKFGEQFSEWSMYKKSIFEIMEVLEHWRNEDHANALVLSRSDVCSLIDAFDEYLLNT